MTSPEPRLRLFVALPLPDGVRAELAGYLARCAELAPGQRWSPPANLHLTLHFLGWVEAAPMARVTEALSRVRRPPLTLRIGGLGRFGTAARPRVLWIGVVAGREGLAALAADVAAACRGAGVVGDDRPYNPHLTLCRVRSGAPLPALPEPPPLPAWKARSFVLFRSRPGPRGSVYEPLREFDLLSNESPPGYRE